LEVFAEHARARLVEVRTLDRVLWLHVTNSKAHPPALPLLSAPIQVEFGSMRNLLILFATYQLQPSHATAQEEKTIFRDQFGKKPVELSVVRSR